MAWLSRIHKTMDVFRSNLWRQLPLPQFPSVARITMPSGDRRHRRRWGYWRLPPPDRTRAQSRDLYHPKTVLTHRTCSYKKWYAEYCKFTYHQEKNVIQLEIFTDWFGSEIRWEDSIIVQCGQGSDLVIWWAAFNQNIFYLRFWSNLLTANQLFFIKWVFI